ncbi:ribosome recycling factor [Lysobacter sp. cf310]|uniref:ribosome recycling factor n=1 Tax=Lysobacter sp. cf310 TaxID=1761790 RepID=UPI0008E313A3|nr:ribosome recycling factor [Lysobacter sp. cf310]SFK27849.1 ribosome recycling factor [Lysobacter sp. cf310]
MLNDIKKDAQTRMAKSVEAFRHDLTRVRTGRASTALVDHLKVNYYGSDMPLSQVASVAISDARTLMITPWEKQMVGPVEKAILASDLGLTPNTAGTVIRINLPALTEERRKELSKHVHSEGENAKVAIRNIRRDANHQVKELLKDKQITEDEAGRSETEIQKITDSAIKDVDEVIKAKEQELMAV